MAELPAYDELPVRPDLPPGSSWGVWGDADRLGCLNLLSEERARRGAALVRRGAVFALNLEMELPDPPLFGRGGFRHEVTTTAVAHDDVVDGWNTQSSSQWDGFRHIRHPVHGFYGGVADEEHGIDVWGERGIATRGVLADVAAWRAAQGRPVDASSPDAITPDDLLGCLADEGVAVEPGDVLLVRTGWLRHYRDLDVDGRRALAGSHRNCGLATGEAMARTLWDLHVAAVAADNPSLEAWPPGSQVPEEERDAVRADPERLSELFLHFALLPLLGLPVGELFDLESLAADCAEDGVYEFQFTSAPLRLRSGVASPPNALAIK